MEKYLIILFMIFCSAVFGFNFIDVDNNLRKNSPRTVPYVDVSLYLGKWYEQATIPYFF